MRKFAEVIKSLKGYKIREPNFIIIHHQSARMRSVKWSPSGNKLAMCDDNGEAKVIDFATGNELDNATTPYYGKQLIKTISILLFW